jgi:DUF2075 family protein
MAKFIIKESSIKDGNDANKRTLDLITGELKKFVNELTFNMVVRQGNYAYWESQDFTTENFNQGYDVDKLNVFLGNTLNFRYENFKVNYAG